MEAPHDPLYVSDFSDTINGVYANQSKSVACIRGLVVLPLSSNRSRLATRDSRVTASRVRRSFTGAKYCQIQPPYLVRRCPPDSPQRIPNTIMSAYATKLSTLIYRSYTTAACLTRGTGAVICYRQLKFFLEYGEDVPPRELAKRILESARLTVLRIAEEKRWINTGPPWWEYQHYFPPEPRPPPRAGRRGRSNGTASEGPLSSPFVPHVVPPSDTPYVPEAWGFHHVFTCVVILWAMMWALNRVPRPSHPVWEAFVCIIISTLTTYALAFLLFTEFQEWLGFTADQVWFGHLTDIRTVGTCAILASIVGCEMVIRMVNVRIRSFLSMAGRSQDCNDPRSSTTASSPAVSRTVSVSPWVPSGRS